MSETVEIPLTRGMVTVVDADDAPRLLGMGRGKWSALNSGHGYYAVKGGGGALMHRLLLGAEKGQCVDHINGDTLDNRRENLRLCTAAENSRNARLPKSNTSGFKGVSWCRIRRAWRAYVCPNRSMVDLGYYDCPIEAARRYDKAAIYYFGEFARTNFPREEYETA